MSQNTPVSSKFNKLSIDIYLIYIFSNFQYFWTKTFWDSYTSIRQIFSTWQWFPSIWCDYIWICKNSIANRNSMWIIIIQLVVQVRVPGAHRALRPGGHHHVRTEHRRRRHSGQQQQHWPSTFNLGLFTCILSECISRVQMWFQWTMDNCHLHC